MLRLKTFIPVFDQPFCVFVPFRENFLLLDLNHQTIKWALVMDGALTLM